MDSVVKNTVVFFLFGLKDCFVGYLHAIRIISKNNKIRSNVALCFILNGLILAFSVVLFEQVILPVLLILIGWSAGFIKNDLSSSHLEWVKSVISYTFTGLWMLPMMVLTTPINSLWIRDIAVEANKHFERQTGYSSSRKTTRWSIKTMIADLLFSIVIEIVFGIQATVFGFLPFCGWSLGTVHMAILYSLYSFEYKWFYQGIPVKKRLFIIEINWPYFLGYGLPISLLTSTPLFSPLATSGSIVTHKAGNLVLSACVFALSFPLMVLGSFSVKHAETSCSRLPIFKIAQLFCNFLFKFLLHSKN